MLTSNRAEMEGGVVERYTKAHYETVEALGYERGCIKETQVNETLLGNES